MWKPLTELRDTGVTPLNTTHHRNLNSKIQLHKENSPERTWPSESSILRWTVSCYYYGRWLSQWGLWRGQELWWRNRSGPATPPTTTGLYSVLPSASSSSSWSGSCILMSLIKNLRRCHSERVVIYLHMLHFEVHVYVCGHRNWE